LIIKPVEQEWKEFDQSYWLRKQYFKLKLGTSLLLASIFKSSYQRKQLTKDLREVCDGFSGIYMIC